MPVRTDTTSQWRDRLIGLFKKSPDLLFSPLQIKERLSGIKEPILNYHLKRLTEDAVLVRPKHGFYQLNPDQTKTMTVEEMRAKVDAHVAENPRVFPSGEGFDPLRPPLTAGEHPALPARRRHFHSIVDRMKVNPSFSASDIEFLKEEVSAALRLGNGELKAT